MTFRRRCNLCQQPIVFHRTVKSREAGGKPKWMPLDPDPHPQGSIAIDGHGDAQPVGVGHPLHDGELHRPHFETCGPYRERQPQRRLPGQEID